MGNCIDRQQVVSWAEDDEAESWELMADEAMTRGWQAAPASKAQNMEEEAENATTSSSSSSSSSSVVVKMRITKRQLNELLRLANKKGVDVQRMLAHVMNTGAVVRRGSGMSAQQWAPRLESIPEVPENEALLL